MTECLTADLIKAGISNDNRWIYDCSQGLSVPVDKRCMAATTQQQQKEKGLTMAKKLTHDHPLIKMILSKNLKTKAKAYDYFDTDVEIKEAEALAKAYKAYDHGFVTGIIEGFIDRWHGVETEEPEEPKTKKGKTKKVIAESHDDITGPAGYRRHVPDSKYNTEGGLGVIDYYANQLGDAWAHDELKHIGSRWRIKRGSTNLQRGQWLRKLWFAAIDQAREDGDQNFFTQIIRHQIHMKVKDETEKAKVLKGIPMPKDA